VDKSVAVIINVLGSSAGGGLPQWNCRAANSAAARLNPGLVVPRTQSSLAVSPDGRRWVLLNASPDLREQIGQTTSLHPDPDGPLRNSPIEAVVLTNADVDHIAGLLTLREGHEFALHATARVLSVLAANPVFGVLDGEKVQRLPMQLERWVEVLRPSGGFGPLDIRAFAVPGKVALYLEDASAGPGLGTREGDTIGLEVSDGQSTFHYIPGLAAIDAELKLRLAGSKLLVLDGTLFTDDEMVIQGLSQKTGRRMGHISMSGKEGSLAGLAALGIGRRVYVHMNNSNPVLREGSPERVEVEEAGWEIAFDGMEINL
jgi:pyrroloquinoline quinone biosynthesis protein B